jgi:large repetitive protein
MAREFKTFKQRSRSKVFSVFLIFMIVFSTVTPSFAVTNDRDSEMKTRLTSLFNQVMPQAQATDSPWNKISRVNVKSSGDIGFGGHSFSPSLSEDGRYVAFSSNMALVEGKNVQYDDVYIHDRLTGTTNLVSNGLNQPYANNSSSSPSINGDGHFIAFESNASNLVAGDQNGMTDIFVKDLTNQTTERISVSTTGVEADESSYEPSISADGRYVAYYSYATNLVDGVSIVPDTSILYIRDRSTQSTIQINNADGEPVKGYSIKISANGQYVVFDSPMNNLVPDDFNNNTDVFVYQIQTGQIERVSLTSTGDEVLGGGSGPFISGDGNLIAFTSSSSDYVPGITEYRDRIYLHNRMTGMTELISMGLNGADPDGHSMMPMIGGDGRYIIYESEANNLVEGDYFDPNRFLGSQYDVFVYDTVTQRTERVDFPREGEVLNGHSAMPAISANGKVVAFASWATTLEERPQQGVFVTYDQASAPVWPSNSNLSITDVTQQSLRLNWPKLEEQNVRGYRIYQDGKRIGFAESYESNFNVVNIDSANAYTFKVQAVSDSYVLSSNGPSLSNIDDEPPVWPAGTELKAEAIGPTNITFSWTEAQDNSGVEYYEVAEVVDEASQNYRVLAATPFTFINLTELTPETEYKLAVRAKDANGNYSIYSPILTIKTNKGETVKVESALFVELQSGRVANLRWVPDEKASVQTYEVWRAKAAEEKQLITTLDATATTYQDSGLLAETDYTYQVIGKDEVGDETYWTKAITVTSAPIQASALTWSLDQIKGFAKQGGTLSMRLTGGSNYTGEALLLYKTVDNDNLEQHIVLSEKEAIPGLYEGTYQLPAGVTELTSLHATLTDNEGHLVTKEANNWQQPIKATGSLTMNLSYNGEIGDYLVGGRLVAWSESKRTGTSIRVGNGDSYQLNDLVPSEDYTVRLFLPGGNLIKEVKNLTVLSGRSQASTLTIDIPAFLQLKVLNPTGSPVSNVVIRLLDEHDQFIQELMTDADGKTARLDGFITNQRLKAEFVLTKQPYQSETKSFTLEASDNLVELTLTPLEKGTVAGVVTGSTGLPLANINVNVYQSVDNRSFEFKTVTDAEGKYQVELYEGTAYFSFSSGGWNGNGRILGSFNEEEVITANQTLTLNKSLVTMEKGELNLQVYSKTIGESWKGPYDLNQLVASGFQVNFSNHVRYWWGDLPASPPISIEGFAGDKIEICVSHTYIGYTCEKVTIDENFNATATIYLEEKGGRIEGNVVTELAGEPIGDWRGHLMKYNPDTKQWENTWESSVYPRGLRISTTIYEVGKYKLEIEHTDADHIKRFAQTEFDLLNGEVKNLGNILLNEIGLFSGQKGSYFTATPTETSPGRVVTYRGTYQHMQEQSVNGATLILDIPNGTTFKEGSIVVNGKVPAEGEIVYDSSKNRYEVTLNEVKPNEQGVVQYQVQLNKDLEQAEISSTLRIAFTEPTGGQKEEIIGLAVVKTPVITLEGIKDVTSLHVPVSGKAPANSEVLVFAGNTLLGSTKAIATGIWSMELDLPDLGQTRLYKLRAETKIDEKTYRSEIFNLYYDQDKPVIQSIAMFQNSGNKTVIDPAKGLARFPFSVNPRLPVLFEVSFTDPSKVRNVEVHMGDSSALAIFEEGVYRASVPLGEGMDIYVTYDLDREPPTYDWDPIDSKEELEQGIDEAKKSLPYELQNFEVEDVKVTEDATTGTFSSEMSVSVPNMVDGLKVQLSITPDADYTPTAEEVASGTNVFDLSYDLEKIGDDYSIKASAYVPDTRQGAAAETFNHVKKGEQMIGDDRMSANLVLPANTGQVAIQVAKVSVDVFLKGWDVKGLGDTFFGLTSNNEILNAWQNQLKLCPNPTLSTQIENLRMTMYAFEALKYGVTAGSMAVGGLGVVATGGLALPVAGFSFVVGLGIGFALDSGISANMDMMESMVAEHMKKCLDDPGKDGKKKKYKPINRPGSGAGSGAGGPIAKPIPKYDPSGYVYEAIESNRLEGVKATVFNQNPDMTLWEVWDAAWFEEVNPQVTDKMGRYGWDVPEGWWQVCYEKDGYVPAKSAELKVLPPHFDVNIGMVSYAPPQVEALRAISSSSGQDFIEVTLSKYIDVDSLTNGTITLHTAAGEPMNGVVKALQNEQEEIDKRLTRVVRFEPINELVVGNSYPVTVNSDTVYSYSGVQMANPYTSAVLVEAKDESAPELVMATVDPSGRVIHLTFDESLSGELDPSAFTLGGTDAEAYLVNYDGFDPSNKKIVINLSGSIFSNENARIGIAAGSVSDVEGNSVQAISKSLTNRVQSDNAELSQLSFPVGKLSPAFNPGIKEYTLMVGKTVTAIEMTPTLANAKASIQMNGLAVDSGLVRNVDLTGDETIITLYTKAEDQRTLDRYVIKVIRSESLPEVPSEPNEPTGPIVPVPPSVPDAVVKGDEADITAWFEQDSKGMVNFNKDAMSKLSSLAKVKTVIVDLTKATGEIPLFLPVQAITKLIEKEMKLVVRTANANIILTPDLATLKDLIEKLGAKEEDVMLRLVVVEKEGVKDTQMNAISGFVQLSTDLVVGEKVAPLSSGLQVELQISSENAKAVKDYHKLGVYQFGESGWRYVRSLNDASENLKMTFNPDGSGGGYQIFEFHKTFADIEKHWAKQEIEWLASKHVVIGNQANYAPNAKVTKVQFATMLARALGLKEYQGKEQSYVDVSPKHWAFGIIEAVTRAGFMDVNSAKIFKPGAPITREEIVISIIRAMESEMGEIKVSASEQEQILGDFLDADLISPEAKESLAKAIKEGIIKGVNQTEIQPKQTTTRAQAAVIIRRFMSALGIL